MAKIGIKNKNDLAKLGIDSSDLKKIGIDPKVFEEVSKAKIEIGDITHSTKGDFTYNPKTGKVSRMKGGGHGQDNIDFLIENNIEFNIEKTYSNGVRVGNVPKHKTPSKRIGTEQAWFPENWSNDKIKNAGGVILC